MNFEIYRRLTIFGRRYYWRLKGANGEIIAVGGEGFHNRGDVVDVINLIMDADMAKIKDVA